MGQGQKYCLLNSVCPSYYYPINHTSHRSKWTMFIPGRCSERKNLKHMFDSNTNTQYTMLTMFLYDRRKKEDCLIQQISSKRQLYVLFGL